MAAILSKPQCGNFYEKPIFHWFDTTEYTMHPSQGY